MYRPIRFLFTVCLAYGQQDTRMYDIIGTISANRIISDVETLANFGTRHTLSDTLSKTRGIGAARRWIEKPKILLEVNRYFNGNCVGYLSPVFLDKSPVWSSSIC